MKKHREGNILIKYMTDTTSRKRIHKHTYKWIHRVASTSAHTQDPQTYQVNAVYGKL